ncbi:hypothetical protein Hanom_Chr17g01582871 [Helianthus anomalus]
MAIVSDDDEILVSQEHLSNVDPEDGDVYDLAILELASPIVSFNDISSDSDLDSDTDSRDSVTSSALLAAGLRAYPTDDDDDDMSVVPSSPVHISTPPPPSSPPPTSPLLIVRAPTEGHATRSLNME